MGKYANKSTTTFHRIAGTKPEQHNILHRGEPVGRLTKKDRGYQIRVVGDSDDALRLRTFIDLQEDDIFPRMFDVREFLSGVFG